MEDLEKALFYKPTGTVQIANKFSLVERKLLNAIIWHSQKNKFKRDELSIPIRDVFSLIGLEKSANYEVIKDALRVLTSTIIEWNTFGEDRITEWGVCTFLASGIIKNGKLKYILNPKLVEQINQPTLYAKILLLVQSQVKKRHALVLYEFFLDALSRAQQDSLNIIVPVSNLYHLLGVNQEMTYKIFNRDVIKPSLNEISKHTDVDVSCTVNRKGRCVHEIVFNLEKRDSLQLSLDFDIKKNLNEINNFSLADSILDIEDNPLNEADLFNLLKLHGIGEKKAKQLVVTFDPARILGNISYLLDQQRQGKTIANIQAYLIKSIEEDYRPKKSLTDVSEEKIQQEKKQTKTKTKTNKSKKESQEAEWKRFCEQRIKDKFAAQPREWQEEQRKNFIAKIKTENLILYNSYKKNAFNSPMIQALFYSSLRDKLLTTPEETSLEHYLQNKHELEQV